MTQFWTWRLMVIYYKSVAIQPWRFAPISFFLFLGCLVLQSSHPRVRCFHRTEVSSDRMFTTEHQWTQPILLECQEGHQVDPALLLLQSWLISRLVRFRPSYHGITWLGDDLVRGKVVYVQFMRAGVTVCVASSVLEFELSRLRSITFEVILLWIVRDRHWGKRQGSGILLWHSWIPPFSWRRFGSWRDSNGAKLGHCW